MPSNSSPADSDAVRSPLAELLTDASRKLRLDAKEIADKVGVAPSTVYDWLRGKTTPHRPHLLQLAETLQLDPDVVDAAVAGRVVTRTDASFVAVTQQLEAAGREVIFEISSIRLRVPIPPGNTPIHVEGEVGPIGPIPFHYKTKEPSSG